MSRNAIQFQKGLSLPKFLEKYGSEAACREALFKLRWPEGFRCPECGNDTSCQLRKRPLIQCHRCHHQTSLQGFCSDSVDRWARRHLSPDAEVTSDGLQCFRAIVETCPHWSIATGGGPSSVEKQEFTWVNTMLGNIKNAIHGTYHSIHGKHLGRYLGAFAYRFNRRFELDRMIERFAYVACRTAPLPRKFAVMAEEHT